MTLAFIGFSDGRILFVMPENLWLNPTIYVSDIVSRQSLPPLLSVCADRAFSCVLRLQNPEGTKSILSGHKPIAQWFLETGLPSYLTALAVVWLLLSCLHLVKLVGVKEIRLCRGVLTQI